jgi:hypothetical protein
VTVDMGFDTFRAEFEQAKKECCQPESFCKLEEKQCRCNEDGDFAKLCKDNDICGRWGGTDVDCPNGGIYGVGVRFPNGSVADDPEHRPPGPPAGCLHASDAGWDVPLVYAAKELLGACAGTPIPPPQFCQP